MTANRTDIFTVSKLNKFAKHILEAEIGHIWLSGEISNFVAASSGHWYFTLKDDKAQIKGAMFRGANRTVTTRPKEGDHVLIRGNVSLYEARGDYQLIASHLEPEGIGRLKQQFEVLKQKLSQEGLFSQSHKSPVPSNASRIGIITSATGAALHDVLTVLKRRSPATAIIVYPTQVQGTDAPQQIQSALQCAIERNEVDVILLTRGGGSLEDLWCFNDESLARAVFDCPLPIVSAVGHEIDFTICDFVADLRAATPSAAAELLSVSQQEQIDKLHTQQHKLTQQLRNVFRHARQQLQIAEGRLQQIHPARQLQQQWQNLDNLQFRLHNQMQTTQKSSHHRLQLLQNRLAGQNPQRHLQQEQLNIAGFAARLEKSMKSSLKDGQANLRHYAQLLDTVSPLATLSCGYSITEAHDNIVTDVSSLTSGDVITTRLNKGKVTSKVTKIEPAS
ncbi:MAG: exodeoxyribonuclease VII large subunit [Aestuariibacter sp.]